MTARFVLSHEHATSLTSTLSREVARRSVLIRSWAANALLDSHPHPDHDARVDLAVAAAVDQYLPELGPVAHVGRAAGGGRSDEVALVPAGGSAGVLGRVFANHPLPGGRDLSAPVWATVSDVLCTRVPPGDDGSAAAAYLLTVYATVSDRVAELRQQLHTETVTALTMPEAQIAPTVAGHA